MNVERSIEQDGVVKWVRDSLSGPLSSALGRAVLASINLEHLTWRVYAEESVSESKLLDFRGGSKTTPPSHSNQWIIESLLRDFAENDDYVVCADWLGRRTDKAITEKQLPAFICGNEVYYIISIPGLQAEPHPGRILRNVPPSFHAFAVTGCAIPQSQELDEPTILRMAGHVMAIIVGVYDGESYLYGKL